MKPIKINHYRTGEMGLMVVSKLLREQVVYLFSAIEQRLLGQQMVKKAAAAAQNQQMRREENSFTWSRGGQGIQLSERMFEHEVDHLIVAASCLALVKLQTNI